MKYYYFYQIMASSEIKKFDSWKFSQFKGMSAIVLKWIFLISLIKKKNIGEIFKMGGGGGFFFLL